MARQAMSPLTEANRSRRVSGGIFADGLDGGRTPLADTLVEIRSLIIPYGSVAENVEPLSRSYRCSARASSALRVPTISKMKKG